MYLPLFVLLTSFVHLSSPREIDKNELFVNLTNGFPAGSLVTVYLKNIPNSEPKYFQNSIAIDLYGDYTKSLGRLQFRIDGHFKRVVSNVAMTAHVWGKEDRSSFHPMTPFSAWWRFDVYKIDATRFLPFFQGFAVEMRTLGSTEVNVRSVHIRPSDEDMPEPNYDKNDVYVMYKHPEIGMKCEEKEEDQCKPEAVVKALDKQGVEENKDKKFRVGTLKDGLPVGKKIRLSALMLSTEPDYADFYPTLYFSVPGGAWTFAIVNKWHSVEKANKMYLLAGYDIPKTQDQNWQGEKQTVICDTSSTDIVHLKLWRPAANPTLIKMRIYYKNGSAFGESCQIDIGTDAKHLEGPLEILVHQGAVLLHLQMV